jgi:hypothetical protein
MDEDLKRAIEDLSVVRSVRFHAGDKTHKAGVYTNLVDCLRELGRLIQQDHGPTYVTVEQKLQADEVVV